MLKRGRPGKIRGSDGHFLTREQLRMEVPDEIILTGSQSHAVREVVQISARLFYSHSPEQVLVLDLLSKYHCLIKEEAIIKILKLKDQMISQTLQILNTQGCVKFTEVHLKAKNAVDETSSVFRKKKSKFNKKFKKNVKVLFWCIDLRYYVALTKYRIDALRTEVRQEVKTINAKEYMCPNCRSTFEIAEVMVRGRNTLQCPRFDCVDTSQGVPKPFLVVPNPEMEQNKTPLPVLLDQQLKPLLDALRKISFQIPRMPTKKIIDWVSDASFVPLPIYFLEKGRREKDKSFEVIVQPFPHIAAPIPIINRARYLPDDRAGYQHEMDRMVKALPPWMRSTLKDAKDSFHMEQRKQHEELELLRSNVSKQRVSVVASAKDRFPVINEDFFHEYIPHYLTEFWRQIEGFANSSDEDEEDDEEDELEDHDQVDNGASSTPSFRALASSRQLPASSRSAPALDPTHSSSSALFSDVPLIEVGDTLVPVNAVTSAHRGIMTLDQYHQYFQVYTGFMDANSFNWVSSSSSF
ncbi:MAG: hypothetical protein Q8P67_26935 [archaeon]|nr:hypothetical protein [archaeon]